MTQIELHVPDEAVRLLETVAHFERVTAMDLVREGIALVLKRLRVPVPPELDRVRHDLTTVYP